jgi:hypothetical protein
MTVCEFDADTVLTPGAATANITAESKRREPTMTNNNNNEVNENDISMEDVLGIGCTPQPEKTPEEKAAWDAKEAAFSKAYKEARDKAFPLEQQKQVDELFALSNAWCDQNGSDYGDFSIRKVWFDGDASGHVGDTVIRVQDWMQDRFAYLKVSNVPKMLVRIKAGENVLDVYADYDEQNNTTTDGLVIKKSEGPDDVLPKELEGDDVLAESYEG